MAISYSEVFGDLGKLISTINSYKSIATTDLPADLAALIAQFDDRWLPEEGIAATFEGLKGSITSWRQTLGGYCDRRLLDFDSVGTFLSLDRGASVQTIVAALRRKMVTDSETVLKCVATVGSVTAASGNAGNGTAYVTSILDGYNPPVVDGQANVAYNGLTTEMTVPSETMTLECLADSATHGLTEGAEQFSLTGGPVYSGLDYRAEGSGRGPAMVVADAGNNLLQNGNLEYWSSNIPASWSLTSGTAGTHLLQETGASNIYRGTSSAKFAGAGTTIRISQSISPSRMQGRRRYFVGCAIKASATDSGATFKVRFSGTGYSEGSDLISVAGSGFPTSWTRYGFFVTMPAPIPSDWALVVEALTLDTGKILYVDSLAVTPAIYHGGVGIALVAGSSRWLKGDRLTFTLANDDAGKFQTFFRKHYRAQLPSVASSETIDDSWAA